MRHVAETRGQGDLGDPKMRATRIGQQSPGALQPVLGDMLRKGLSCLFQQALEAAPRQADPRGDAVNVEAGTGQPPRVR